MNRTNKACRQEVESCQPFPTNGPIRLNCGLSELRRQVAGGDGDCYVYIIDTVKTNASGEFCQEGSGPNWQGGRITLCTCKHWMRSFRDPQGWERCWIAGFTGRKHDGHHWLVYLMQVKHALESHAELWQSGKLPPRALAAKLASRNSLGDLFEPLSSCKDGREYSFTCYRKPVMHHSHAGMRWPDQWHEDIDYQGTGRRRPALLVGNPKLSYLWSQKRIRYAAKLSRGQKRVDLAALLNDQLRGGAA